ncbi:YbfB/YjiJ family MFS transporter [Chromobacterium sp. CV08]|uniref:YbfB/YjiJ family MFS transporter n=1 Tax=Chromobacterium sp. CV08 TaxID=3133274 RepID=UPI003DA99679
MLLSSHKKDSPHQIWLAIALSLGAAIALGIARFSYALLLLPMKVDLGWSFAQAGTMNAANALGYLLGALMAPSLMRSCGVPRTFAIGSFLTAALMAWAGTLISNETIFVQRLLSGISSAFVFVGGGVLALRLATIFPRYGSLVVGIYYGGTGWGIVLSALLIPLILPPIEHGWQYAWLGLAIICLLMAVIAIPAAFRVEHWANDMESIALKSGRNKDKRRPSSGRLRIRSFSWALGSYGLFGIGYIGYMTFIIALLRGVGMSNMVITIFYTMLGVAVIISSRIWSGLLNRARGGLALAVLNALLGLATLMPAFLTHPAFIFISGLVFGGTFLAIVASTTAFVRHNLATEQWTLGISAFTMTFALGQIIGPLMIGLIADGSGLERGLMYSSACLIIGAIFAACQRQLQNE